MSDNPLSSEVKLDVTNYKAGIAELNRQQRVLESGFRASAAAMGAWDKTSDGLESRIKSLSGQIGLQQQKVSGLQRVYDELAGSGNASAKELEELQIKINRQTEVLNGMESELNQSKTALDGLGGEVQNTGKDFQEAEGKTQGFKISLSDLEGVAKGVGVAIGAVVGAVTALGGAVVGLVVKTAEAADELQAMSDKTGLSTERLQQLSYIGNQVGVDLDTITGANTKLIRSMDAARSGTGDQAAAFATLGIAVTDSSGQLRSSQTVFNEAIAALGGVKNETERDALAMALFGKSAMDLNPMIKAGTDELTRLGDEAYTVGAVMSSDTVSGMASLNDEMDSLKDGFKGTMGTLAGSFLPGFQGLAGTAKGYLGDLVTIVQGSGGDLTKVAKGLGKLLSTMLTDAVKAGPELLQTGLGLVQGIVDAIIANLPMLLPAVMEMLNMIVIFILQQIPTLLDAGLQIITMLATGIAQSLPTMIPAIVAIIPQIITTLLSNLPLLINAALQIITGLANGLLAALPTLIAAAPQIIQQLVTTLVQQIPLIITTAGTLIVGLVTGIINNLPALGQAALQIVTSIVTGIGALGSQILDVGLNIVKGVWQGISDAAQWFTDQVTNFFNGIVEAVKDVLNIASPSGVFKDIGKNMALGVDVGFGDTLNGVERNIRKGMKGLTDSSYTIGVTGNPALAGVGGIVVNVYGNTLNNDLDIYDLSYRVADEIQRRQ